MDSERRSLFKSHRDHHDLEARHHVAAGVLCWPVSGPVPPVHSLGHFWGASRLLAIVSRDWRWILINRCVTPLGGNLAQQDVSNRTMKESNNILSIVQSCPDDSHAAPSARRARTSSCLIIDQTPDPSGHGSRASRSLPRACSDIILLLGVLPFLGNKLCSLYYFMN